MHLLANADVRVLVASRDGMRIATIPDDGQVVSIWDAMTGAHCSTLPLPKDVLPAFSSLAWSPDRRYLAAGTLCGEVCVWHCETQMLVRVYRGHTGGVSSVSWSPEGTILASASYDGRIHVWTTDTQDSSFLLSHFRGTEAFEVAWSPDGSHLASCWQDGRVHIWQIQRRRCVFTYRGHGSAVRSCAWSLDGTRIVSAGDDATVQVWRVPIGGQWWRRVLGVWGIRLFHLVLQGGSKRPVTLVRWSPDGSALAALSDDGVSIWNATDATCLATQSGRALRSFAWFRGGTRLLLARDHVIGCQSWHWQNNPGLDASSCTIQEK